MDKVEFYKQMIAFGQELLAKEQKPKLNEKAIVSLQKIYDALDIAVNAAADLGYIFGEKDRRSLIAWEATELIMKTQRLMKPLAEDEDIKLFIKLS
jgi:hypothetical protein